MKTVTQTNKQHAVKAAAPTMISGIDQAINEAENSLVSLRLARAALTDAFVGRETFAPARPDKGQTGKPEAEQKPRIHAPVTEEAAILNKAAPEARIKNMARIKADNWDDNSMQTEEDLIEALVDNQMQEILDEHEAEMEHEALMQNDPKTGGGRKQ